MNYVEVVPISEYEGALKERLPEHELSIGVLYNAVFTLKEHRKRAIRFNTLLSELHPDATAELSPVDADLRPLGWMIYTDITDGIMKTVEGRSAGLAYNNKRTGNRETAMLHTGILRSYENPVDIGPLLISLTIEDRLVTA